MRIVLLLVLFAACGSPQEPPRMEPYEAGERMVVEPADPAASMPLSLRAKFEWSDEDPLPVVSPASLDEEDPFTGNELGSEDFDVLDEQLLAMARYDGLYACFEVGGGLFVLRGPGAGAPTDLFLADWSGTSLAWVVDLAFDHCTDEGCASMRSWLTDLDGDGRRDVVRRSLRDDPESGTVENVLDAWIVGSNGALSEATLSPADRARFE